jgi:hypothetical protein
MVLGDSGFQNYRQQFSKPAKRFLAKKTIDCNHMKLHTTLESWLRFTVTLIINYHNLFFLTVFGNSQSIGIFFSSHC